VQGAAEDREGKRKELGVGGWEVKEGGGRGRLGKKGAEGKGRDTQEDS